MYSPFISDVRFASQLAGRPAGKEGTAATKQIHALRG
jgi:hypothetical protein